ncbi:hypothetical protein [Candidatus Planktophila versatilis]|uniref:Uncharacterized protein n=1 Tax=Candidatus Planktophila versatilis TaxID=1884905 RepID=A0ABM6MD05_9ACTN|nr:hypothetical protein [Candidatus Planktophila versatilis]ASY16785.1 hypothetical protein A1sIA79_00675 [Candidatus Planktophila versatilis]
MAKLDSEDLLAAWQVLWGRLEPEWHSVFTSDPLVARIIWYDSEFIYPSLKKFRKLSEVLHDIKANTVIQDLSVDEEVRKEFLKHVAERDALLESRKMREKPKQVKADPAEMSPLEPIEITMEDLRNQPGDRHWW